MKFSRLQFRAFVFTLGFVLLLNVQGWAGTTGSLAGSVLDKKSKLPLKGALITVEEAGVHGISDKYGNFLITGLQPGIYRVEVRFIGYAEMAYEKVHIKTDAITRLTFALDPIVLTTEPIIITGARNPIDEEMISTVHYVDNEDLNSRVPGGNYLDHFKFLPGVFSTHFRGSRSAEVLYLLDGVPMVSSLTRELAFDIPISAIEEVVVYTGGYSAEYGNANAGIVNVIRKRARSQFEYTAKTYTDYLGFAGLPHDNYRRIQVGFGGPVTMSFGGPVVESNYYISLDANASDTPRRPQLRQVFDETIQKNLNGSIVFDLKLSRNLTLSAQGAFSNWQWRDIDDNSLEPLNTIPLRKNKHATTSIALTHTLTPTLFYKISASYVRLRDAIEGQIPDSLNAVIFSNTPVISRSLNLPVAPWEQRISEDLYYLNANLFKQVREYLQFKAGVGVEYYDIAMQAQRYAVQPNRFEIDPEDKVFVYSRFANDFRKFPFALSGYAEVHLKSRYFNGQFGARIDYLNANATRHFSVQQDENTSPSHQPYDPKLTVSPRISFSIPLSKKDIVFFNYGRFTQIPSLYHLYAGIVPVGEGSLLWPLLGNPDLRPSESVSYELAFSKDFGASTRFKLTGFYRNDEKLLDSQANRFFTNANAIPSQYSNQAFARSRGLEVLLSYNFSSHFSGQAVYTIMKTTGTTNYAEENYHALVRAGFVREKDESSLNWDQRHSILLGAEVKYPRFYVNLSWRLYSPREWTDQTTTSTLAARLPLRNLFDLVAMYRLHSGTIRILPFVEVRNLFNVRYREYRDTLNLVNNQPLIPFQEQYGRRIRFGIQIN